MLKEYASTKKQLDDEMKGKPESYQETKKKTSEYKLAEAANGLRSTYSSLSSKATKLEGEGEKVKAARLKQLIEQSKSSLKEDDFTIASLKFKSDMLKKKAELITK